MKEFLVWLSVQLLIKVASSEWMLAVQIQQFENLFNAEKPGDYYCCCDNSPCNENISVLTQCVASCDTYFKVYFPACSNNEICPEINTNVIENSQSIIQWRPDLQLLLEQSNLESQNQVIVEAWDYDSSDNFFHDEIDRFEIPLGWKALNFVQSKSLTIEGEFGIGKLTLSYYNITDGDTSSCSSHTQKATSTTTADNNMESMVPATVTVSEILTTATSTTTADNNMKSMVPATVTVSEILHRVTFTATADNNMKSIVPATVTVSEILPIVTMSAEVVMSSSMWKTIALVFLVVAISSIIINIALGIIAYHIRKGVKLTSKFTAHEELETAALANVSMLNNLAYGQVNATNTEKIQQPHTETHHIYDHVDNTLYRETNAPDSDQFKSVPTDKHAGRKYI